MPGHSVAIVKKLEKALQQYEVNEFQLPGIKKTDHRDVFIKQVIDSMRRVRYVSTVESRPLDPDRSNPSSDLFDPIRAALIHKNAGDVDEACWLVFLFVHFGKHSKSGWWLVRQVYGKLNQHPFWSWSEVSADPELFRDWLRQHLEELKGRQRGFGNHRKYQSLDADKTKGTGEAVKTYVEWVLQYGGHQQLIDHALKECGNDPKKAFHWLYRSMEQVISFGRVAKFDYLAMLGKAGLAPIQPDSPYLADATGPKAGAMRLLEGRVKGGKLSTKEMEKRLVALGDYLEVDMQVIEDSLCNWQKSPSKYQLFSG